MTVNLAQTEMNIRIASLWSSSSHVYSTTLIPAPSKCQNVGQLKLLAHNFLTENFPCESYSMCDQGVDWWEHHDQNQNIFLFAFLGLIVLPCLSAQLLASILTFYMTAQCELFYRCYYNQISNATVANRTMWHHGPDVIVPFTSSSTILFFTCPVWGIVYH